MIWNILSLLGWLHKPTHHLHIGHTYSIAASSIWCCPLPPLWRCITGSGIPAHEVPSLSDSPLRLKNMTTGVNILWRAIILSRFFHFRGNLRSQGSVGMYVYLVQWALNRGCTDNFKRGVLVSVMIKIRTHNYRIETSVIYWECQYYKARVEYFR